MKEDAEGRADSCCNINCQETRRTTPKYLLLEYLHVRYRGSHSLDRLMQPNVRGGEGHMEPQVRRGAVRITEHEGLYGAEKVDVFP